MAIQLGSFPGTYINTATDIRQELSDLHTLCIRSSAAVSKQIEEYIDAVYDITKTGIVTGTPPDATAPATVTLKQLYPDFTAFTRAERIKVHRLLTVSENVTVRDAVAAQLQHFLETLGWTFA